MNLINVDFKNLKDINSDTVGWIQVNGTNINYPFVQTTDNDYYLTHSFYKKSNDAGWVFLDYRNNIKSIKTNRDRNIILYAHSRLDKTMFGSLTKILKSDWIKNISNYVIKMSTETENTLWQIFSAYRIPTTNDYLRIQFPNNDDFMNFYNTIANRSQHNFNAVKDSNDKILTLSTCYNNFDKFVVHAKLLKVETKIII